MVGPYFTAAKPTADTGSVSFSVGFTGSGTDNGAGIYANPIYCATPTVSGGTFTTFPDDGTNCALINTIFYTFTLGTWTIPAAGSTDKLTFVVTDGNSPSYLRILPGSVIVTTSGGGLDGAHCT